MTDPAASYCRICLESERSKSSLYLDVRQKYLPSVIESLCGVLISSFNEPDALVCKECAVALVQADDIIQKCRKSHKFLVEQRSVSLAAEAVAAEGHLKYETAVASVRNEFQPTKEQMSTCETSLCSATADPHTKSTTVSTSALEVKEESVDDVPDFNGIEENLFVKPELFVESILESSRDTVSGSTTPTLLSASAKNATKYRSKSPTNTTIYQSSLKHAKPKTKLVRSREQYLKRQIRNFPVKEPLKLIGGAGVVRKRKPKTFHRAIPNFYFRCELCHTFESNVASYAVTHLSAMHGIERPAIFRCSQCDTKPFIKNQSLQEHISTIHRQQPKTRDFVCAKCGKTFIKNCHLQKHLISVHKQSKLLVESELPCALPSLSCPHCGYKFLQRTRYDAHIKRARCKPPEGVVAAGLVTSATEIYF